MKQLALSGAALLFLAALLLVTTGVGKWRHRAFNYRLEIRVEFVTRTIETNIFPGAGVTADSHWRQAGILFRHPHSLCVASFYYGGIIGLVLFVSVIHAVFRRVYRYRKHPLAQVAAMTLGYGLMVGLADGNRLLNKIDFLWLLFWILVGLALCLTPEGSGEGESLDKSLH